jgi:hypothetical protein
VFPEIVRGRRPETVASWLFNGLALVSAFTLIGNFSVEDFPIVAGATNFAAAGLWMAMLFLGFDAISRSSERGAVMFLMRPAIMLARLTPGARARGEGHASQERSS